LDNVKTRLIAQGHITGGAVVASVLSGPSLSTDSALLLRRGVLLRRREFGLGVLKQCIYSTVQYSTVQYSTVQYSITLNSTALNSRGLNSKSQYSIVQY
jgi:hypothetical protein